MKKKVLACGQFPTYRQSIVPGSNRMARQVLAGLERGVLMSNRYNNVVWSITRIWMMRIVIREAEMMTGSRSFPDPGVQSMMIPTRSRLAAKKILPQIIHLTTPPL
uniref:Uncharacterized protein n=1 Tax=Cacopsylla melanoneura TaxID=428564 RepID=A0A8D8M3C6_9HEMI